MRPGWSAAATIALLPGAKPAPPETFRDRPVVREERETELTPAMRRAISATLDRFVPAAVGRRDPALAWELAGPGLRAGSTRSDWLAGEMPVFPFPFRGERFHGWREIYAYPDKVGLDLLLHPRDGAKMGAIAVAVAVVRRDRRWLVDTWYPAAVWNAPADRPFVTGSPDFTADGYTATGAYKAPKFAESGLSPVWLAVPLAILGSVLLVPIGFALAAVRRNRRAEAAHAAFRPSRSGARSPLSGC